MNKLTFNQLYALARRGNLELQRRASFDSMTDGMSSDISEWFKPTVEQLKKIKSQGGHYNAGHGEGASIYSYVEDYRVRVA